MANTSAPPVDQAEYWNGPTGEKWAQLQARIDTVFVPLTERLLARAAPQPGELCLDVGCGAGDLALHLALLVGPGGSVTGIDLSKPLLAQARRRAEGEGASLVRWLQADASTAKLLPVDLLVSRFGVMFFSDPVSAFANLRRAMRSDGRLCIMAWRAMRENGWASVPASAVASVIGKQPPPPPGAPGPFAFADKDCVLAILRDAGLANARATPIDADLAIGSSSNGQSALDNAAAYSLQIGPAARAVKDIADEGTRRRAKAAVTDALRPHERDGKVELSAACWIYEATAR